MRNIKSARITKQTNLHGNMPVITGDPEVHRQSPEAQYLADERQA